MITTHLNEFIEVNQKVLSLLEMTFSGYTTHDDLTVFFSKQRKPSIAALRMGNKYDVFFIKQDRMAAIIYNLFGMNKNLSDDVLFDKMYEKAKELGVMKKFSPNLSGSKLIDLLVVKNGVQSEMFSHIFPDVSFDIDDVKSTVGKFNVIGLTKKSQKSIEALIEKVSSLIKKAGYGHILYGDVTVVTKGSLPQRIAADYGEERDDIRVKFPVKIFEDAVHNLIHELGHRQYHKFKTDRTAVHRRWLQATSKYPILRVNDRVVDPKSKREFSVTGIKSGRGSSVKYQGYFVDEPDRNLVARDNIALWDKTTGETDRDVLSVSRYALSNDHEFYSEVFAHGVLGNTNALQWIKEVSSK